MEIDTQSSNADAKLKQLQIGNSAISQSLYQLANGGLACGEILPQGKNHHQPSQQGLDYCPEFELLLTGEGRRFAARSRKLGGCGHTFAFQRQTEAVENDLRVVRLHYRREAPALEVCSCYAFPAEDIPVIRRWTEITNCGEGVIGLEQVSSAIAYHLGERDEHRVHTKNLHLHIPYSSWSGEGQWRVVPVDSLGLCSSDSAHFRASCLGSRSSAEYAPMAMLEDRERQIIWFWQIEHSGSWFWEIGHLFVARQHGLYLNLSGPDEEHGHWWKQLQPEQTFSSIPVALGVVTGGFTEATQALTRYRRLACRQSHPVDDKLPVIFNDYMNCLWGDPTLEKELPLIDAAANVGCEVFCMDSGWYAVPGEHWWPGVGGWEVNRTRFPRDDFEQIFSRIRERRMIPGIWLEAEAVGVESRVAQEKPEEWFLHRHGQRVQYNRRYFWNLRHPEVISYLDGIIDRLIRDYGIGYIKNDYNIDLLQGAEDAADSFGDGLLLHTLALYDWLESIHRRHPDLIWENCAAGGLRCDYGILSRAQLQSSSDQQSCSDYARMVGANLALVLPEQCATWCYPLQKDSLETVAMNVVNAIVCRIHLSGGLASLSPEAFALVKSGIEVYKNHREFLKKALPHFPSGSPSPAADAGFHTVALIGEAATLLTVWKLTDKPATFVFEAGQLGWAHYSAVEVVYPSDAFLPSTLQVEGAVFKVDFPAGECGRLFRLEHRA
jgi:alpha-galactosidase